MGLGKVKFAGWMVGPWTCVVCLLRSQGDMQVDARVVGDLYTACMTLAGPINNIARIIMCLKVVLEQHKAHSTGSWR